MTANASRLAGQNGGRHLAQTDRTHQLTEARHQLLANGLSGFWCYVTRRGTEGQ